MPAAPWLRKTGQVLRDGWVIVGVALAILLTADGLYSAQAAFRLSRHRNDQSAPWLSPRHPQAHESWWKDVPAVVIFGSNIRYDPYRGFWPTPLSSPVINVDSAGLRRTALPAAPADAPQLFFFGGSVMWGWIVPDSLTIPSLAAGMFAAEGHPVRALNLGQPTFQITQEAATLLLKLRGGSSPAVAVFLDGVNEIQSAYENGQAGHIYNEQLFARRFADGRQTGFFGNLVRAGENLAIVQRLALLKSPAPTARPHPEACAGVAKQYARMTRAIAALGREFGFTPLFLWQPMLPTSHKKMGPFEQAVGDPEPGFADMARRCTAMADSAMAAQPGANYIDLAGLFDSETSDIFWDEHGHLVESGNRAVARRIVDLVTPMIARRPDGPHE
ncbi:MAG TPA: hypothetical protein VGI92_02565 [Gemmatimonadales bacterium]|jgi:hypothetical protein